MGCFYALVINSKCTKKFPEVVVVDNSFGLKKLEEYLANS